MGLMRFLVLDRDRIPAGGLDHVYVCGLDELPYFTRAYFSGSQLVVERNESDSGRVHIPWHVADDQTQLVSTSTLMERDRPYLLEVEIARGMANLLRNQLAQWELMGLAVSTELRGQVLEATSDFARAATMQNDHRAAADWAARSLAVTRLAMNALANEYVRQTFELRKSQPRPTVTWLGVQLGEQLPPPEIAKQVPDVFNMACVPFTWRRIEAVEGRRNWTAADAAVNWARGAGLKVTGGPILELDDRGLPDWAYLWEGDIDSLRGFMLDHARAVVQRYRSRIHLWQVAARMTRGRALELDEEARLQITARAISAVRELDPTTPLVVTFDQPWAEYLANEQLDLSALHFADALVCADLGLSGVGLELNVGYDPGGSMHRGPLAFSRLIDTWSLLELPVFVAVMLPSAGTSDPQASGKSQVFGGGNETVSPERQSEWIERYIPLLLSKSQVQVVVWNQLCDALPHFYPHGGLFDASNQPKPGLATLRKIREKYVGGK